MNTKMDDMFLQCNKNAIYVLNTSYRYGELDMINLFGSPAGRAINEITSTKTCSNSESNNISTKSSANNHLQQQQQQPHKHHSSQQQFSCNSQQTTNSIDNRSLHQQHNEIRYNYCSNDSSIEKTTRNLIFKSNVIAKKAKFWKFLEEDKCNKNSIEDLSTSSSGKSSLSLWRRQSKKSSSELYREAAQMLGLSCTLSDSCRCLDCQVRTLNI
ncbi:hypothetical protein Bhyg_09096 [Pseudolycoriella hygida]|uniref:DUF4802 domain-containing protein n=1 Tax=Pseudolycoriella hygida TaxID=35572 RepID=A0A9Q0S5K5_9DIPT|nr:hypothetical protein Bhyg_09096 [Pseudolycoriella hygida]